MGWLKSAVGEVGRKLEVSSDLVGLLGHKLSTLCFKCQADDVLFTAGDDLLDLSDQLANALFNPWERTSATWLSSVTTTNNSFCRIVRNSVKLSTNLPRLKKR